MTVRAPKDCTDLSHVRVEIDRVARYGLSLIHVRRRTDGGAAHVFQDRLQQHGDQRFVLDDQDPATGQGISHSSSPGPAGP